MSGFFTFMLKGKTLILSVLSIAILSYFGWDIAIAVYQGAKTLEPNVYVPLTSTLFIASLGLVGTLINSNVTRNRELEASIRARKIQIESAFRERKIEIYLDFLKAIENLFLGNKEQLGIKPISPEEITLKIADLRTKAVLWGSTGVLRALNEFHRFGQGEPLTMLQSLEFLQREMRADLGLSNEGLEDAFFSKLILSDPNEYDKLLETEN